jgi:cytoskeleton protein RodZ
MDKVQAFMRDERVGTRTASRAAAPRVITRANGVRVSFGRELQLERQRRRISLEAISEGTKVPTRHLRALEQEEYTQLPGGVFNKGIVRSYCRHLGLDEREWLEKFPSNQIVESEPDWESFAENVRRSRVGRRHRTGAQWLGVLVMLMALVGLGWAAWRFVLQPRMAAVPQAGQMHLPDKPGSPKI